MGGQGVITILTNANTRVKYTGIAKRAILQHHIIPTVNNFSLMENFDLEIGFK